MSASGHETATLRAPISSRDPSSGDEASMLGASITSITSIAPEDPDVLNLDVVADHDQAILLKLFYHPLWLLVYLATPWRAASKEKGVRLGISGFQPLWDEAHPRGNPSLNGPACDRVHTANRLIQYSLRVVMLLRKRDVPWSIENPWWYPGMSSLSVLLFTPRCGRATRIN